MPGQPRPHGAAANQRLGKDVVEIMNGVGLRRRRVLPAEAELAHSLFHHTDDVTDLLRDPLRADIAVTHRSLGIAGVAFLRFTAARDDETRSGVLARPRE